MHKEPSAFIFYHHFIVAGVKTSAQKAEECLQKVRDLQKEGWWELISLSLSLSINIYVCVFNMLHNNDVTGNDDDDENIMMV